MSLSPSRNGRAFLAPLSDREAWKLQPSPKQEARGCLETAKKNGGIRAMREVISIWPKERAELDAWIAAEEPELAIRILAAVSYRERVLEEFDELVANEESITALGGGVSFRLRDYTSNENSSRRDCFPK